MLKILVMAVFMEALAEETLSKLLRECDWLSIF